MIHYEVCPHPQVDGRGRRGRGAAAAAAATAPTRRPLAPGHPRRARRTPVSVLFRVLRVSDWGEADKLCAQALWRRRLFVEALWRWRIRRLVGPPLDPPRATVAVSVARSAAAGRKPVVSLSEQVRAAGACRNGRARADRNGQFPNVGRLYLPVCRFSLRVALLVCVSHV